MNEATEIFDWLVFTGSVKEWSRNAVVPIIERELLKGTPREKIIAAFSVYDRLEKTAKRVGELMAQFTQAFQAAAAAFVKLADFKPIPAHIITRLESQTDYAIAGYPYGKSNRGWKKWRKGNQ